MRGELPVKVLNFGSLNLDYVYEVDHFVRPGETLDSPARSIQCGGKGLNQSIALARAGAAVWHAGCIGEGGEPLKALLEENGVDTSCLTPVDRMQGHAVIQVSPSGENAILLYGGSNRCVTEAQIRETVGRFSEGDWLILQNEINALPTLVEEAAEKGLKIVLNPSPWNSALNRVDFEKLSWLFVNEIEMEQITGEKEPEKAWDKIHRLYPRMSVLITLGGRGSVAFLNAGGQTECARQEAIRVHAVDTTAAGDTYTGYFVAGLVSGLSLKESMERAAKAAAVSVTRHGAAPSIPWAGEI